MTNKEFKKLKDDLWLAANKLRADSDLKSNDYSPPVLGIIFLKFADIKYSQHEKQIKAEFSFFQNENGVASSITNNFSSNTTV